jgi:hypothetical protein
VPKLGRDLDRITWLGEYTGAVLPELGIGAQRRADLREQGVI